MRPRTLDSAIIAAMRANPGASITAIRTEVGFTVTEMAEAVQRLRFAGKIAWGRRFALSPSMQRISPAAKPKPKAGSKAKDGAGNARREVQAIAPPEPTLPGPSKLSEQVKAEAAEKGERRALARKISTGLTPLECEESMADRFRRLAREVDDEAEAAIAEAEAEERRQRDLDRLGSPSAVLRRAQRDWPEQCRDVAGIAAELGIGLGECWRRVIKAGVDCLRDCDGEAAA